TEVTVIDGPPDFNLTTSPTLNGALAMKSSFKCRKPAAAGLTLIDRRDVHVLRHGMAYVVRLVFPIRHYNPFMRNLCIWDLLQQMVDAVESRFLLVDALDDPPRRLGNVSTPEHFFLGPGIAFPTAARFEVHRAELPLLERIVDAHQKTQFLLLIRDREPVFDQHDPGPHQHPLELGRAAKELLALRLGAEPHHPFDAGAVVPAAVEQDDFAARRQMRYIALKIPL